MIELLGWLLLHVEVIKGGDSCTELVAPLIVCMQVGVVVLSAVYFQFYIIILLSFVLYINRTRLRLFARRLNSF